MPKEPQSYGSQKDWVTGNVGETVNQQKRTPPAAEEEFYDDRRSSETSGLNQGGQVSDVQLAENDETARAELSRDDQPVTKVTDEKGGAKRGGFFKDRDYS